jgi:ubiquinone/menaquinone biosynthesis C-methylase UbiE
MTLTTAEWHQRYLQQANWTQNLRAYLYKKAGLQQAARILDIGCGTGVLEHELGHYSPSHTFGLDIDIAPLSYARQYAPQSVYTLGDTLSLPFGNTSFDVTFCHFLLLWVSDAVRVVQEMVRVTRSAGYVLALAEPDYGGRIDFPSELSKIGAWQTYALMQQGANPHMGRELRSIFHHAGLVNVEVGVMGGQWGDESYDRDVMLEWDMIRSDLRLNNEFLCQVDRLETLDKDSRDMGQRVLFVPTFYAIGMVKGVT